MHPTIHIEVAIMNPAQQPLPEGNIADLLRQMPDWTLEDGKLVRTWTFADFPHAIEFVQRVAQLAEREGHHPDIDIRYNRVKLALVSHDAGGITQRDADMARQLNSPGLQA